MEGLKQSLKDANEMQAMGVDMESEINKLKRNIKLQFAADNAESLKVMTANEDKQSSEYEQTEITVLKDPSPPNRKSEQKKRKLSDKSIADFFETSTRAVKNPNSNVIGLTVKSRASQSLKVVGAFAQNKCPKCQREFKNAQGLGQHKKTCDNGRCLLTGEKAKKPNNPFPEKDDGTLPENADEVFVFGSNRRGLKLALSGKKKKTRGRDKRMR